MFLLARIRVTLARHPSIYWLVVALLCAVMVTSVLSVLNRAEAARRSWGDSRTAWVASRDIAPGESVSATATDLPMAMIPVDALADPPDDAVATQHIGIGEIVTGVDVGSGPFTLVPDGWQAIAIVTDPATLPAEPGDHVAVYAAGSLIAPDGVVIDIDDTSVVVAVPGDVVAAVSVAALDQRAVLAWRRRS